MTAAVSSFWIMAAPTSDSRASPGRIVGRQAERARVRDAIDRAGSGAGVALLISGEAGIGKTHLARDAMESAAQRGFFVLEGRCGALNQKLAYSPIVEALGRALRGLSSADRSHVLAGLPVLDRLLPGLDLPPDEPTGDAALDRTRLFEAVLRLLDRLCRRAPVALFVDDLGWADRSTLELLAYVTRDLAAFPMLLVGTRPAGAAEAGDRPLDDFIRAVRRSGVVEEITLSPLSDEEIRDVVGGLLGDPSDGDVAQFLIERAKGNPLFAEALLGQLRDEMVLVLDRGRWTFRGSRDVSTPPIVRDILTARITSLAPEERRVLEVIATGGDGVPGSILSDVLGSDPSDVLDRLTARDLVVERGVAEPTYGISHPLFGEVVREALPAAEQRRSHASLADAYRRLLPGEVERRAVHAQRSLPHSDPIEVLEVSVRAGEQALSRSAGAEAVAHFAFALELARRERPKSVPSVLVELGEARYRSGDRVAAAGAWGEAIAALGADADPTEIARLHLRAAIALGDAEFAESDRQVAAGLANLSGRDAPELELELLLVAATTAHRRVDRSGLRATVARIVQTGRGVTSDQGRALVSAARLLSLIEERRYLEAETEVGSGYLVRVGNPLLTARHLSVKALINAVMGNLPALRAVNVEALEAARLLGVPSWDYRTHFILFVEALYGGEWDRADEAIAEARLLGDRISHPLVSVAARLLSAILSAYRADFDAALSACIVEDLIGGGASAQPIRELATAVHGIVELEQGRFERAAGLLAGGSLPLGATMPPWDVVAMGEASARLGRTDAAVEVARELESMGPPGSWPVAMAARVEGLAAATEGRSDLAIGRLEAAAETFRLLSMPFEEARAGLEVAELARWTRDVDATLVDRLTAWLATFDRLGAARYAGRARRLLGRFGHPIVAPIRPTLELTPRQLEIAEFVAAGMSNAEIAERLFLSVRTVTSHLDHIYTRLGISSRAALATYAVESRMRAAPTGDT